MHSPLTLAKYTTISSLFLVLFIFNAFVWQSAILGAGLLFFLLWYYGRDVMGVATIIAALSIYGSLAYYLDLLTLPTVAVGVVLVPLVCWFLMRRFPSPSSKFPAKISFKFPFISLAIFLLLFLSTISILLHTSITEPVRSPWLVIPAAFFIGIFLLALLLVSGPTKLKLIPFFFLTIGVALVVYPLGYGFDSFIHQATEQHILENGTITPKPLYYAGQYALVLFAAHGFAIPIDLADRLLVPLMAAVLIPLMAWRAFSHRATLALFFLPLSSLIVTTPQGLANVWGLIVILGAVKLQAPRPTPTPSRLPLWQGEETVLWLFAAAAIVTHPLAGITLVIFLAILFFSRHRAKFPPISYYLLLFLSSFILPAIFFINAKISGLPVSFSLSNLGSTDWTELLGLHLFAANRFHPFLDAVYLFGWNRILILLGLVIAAGVLVRSKRISNFQFPISNFLIPAGIMLVNYVLLSTLVGFDFLIDYERGNYSARIFEMMQFFLLPVVAVVLDRSSATASRAPTAVRFGYAILLAMVLTSTVYLTYPRHDNFEISRGFNVGASDFDTVRYIHETAGETDYVVLANQAVSAAAMREYGFLKYYPSTSSGPDGGDIFYYPIPTGGPLYKIYLEMVNIGPTRARAEAAMDLTGVDTAYLVVNDYWWLAEKVIENAKREADAWTAISDGSTHVFTFNR